VNATHKMDRPLIALVLVMGLGAMMPTLDATVVNVGVHTLGQRLHASLAQVQWVSTAYLLSVAVSAPLAGWAVDRYGGRRIWMLGLLMFVLGSALCSAAWSIQSLAVCRVLQGAGGGFVEPTMLTVLARAAGPHRLGRVMALTSVPITLGPALGPLLGGVILAHLSWRWLFLVNVPIGLVAALASRRVVPRLEEAHNRRSRFDVIGLLLMGPGFATVLYGLSQSTGPSGFLAPRAVVPMLVGIGLITAYVVHALRTKVVPLIDVRLFSGAAFSVCAAIMTLIGAIFYAALFILPLYYQDVHGRSVLAAGLLMAPLGVGAMLSMTVAGRIADRYGPRIPVCLALGGVCIALLPFAIPEARVSSLGLGVCAFLVGFCLPLASTPVLAAIYVTVKPASVASATSSIYILNQLGASFGVALTALTVQRRLHDGASAAAAFGSAFWLLAGAAAIAVFVCRVLPRHRAGPAGDTVEQPVLTADPR
jgi:EmrB/QacA subfamily drug resistance transporter